MEFAPVPRREPPDDARLRKALAKLPHGPEFRFIDELLSLEPGARAAGQYRVRGDEPFLAGHFPGAPLWPGVLLLEGAAQLAGILVQTDPHHQPFRELKLAAVRAVKIRGSARPGEIIVFNAELLGRLRNLVEARGAASVGGREIMQGQLTLSGDQ